MSYAPGPSGSAPPTKNVTGYKAHQIQNYTPQAMKFYEDYMDKIGGGAMKGADYYTKIAAGDQSVFDEIEKPAYNAYEKQIGALGNRFSHLGALDSNYFENATAGAGRELQENLASKRTELRQKAIDTLMNQSSALLDKKPFETVYEKEKDPNEWMNVLSSMGPEFMELFQSLGLGGDGSGGGMGNAGAKGVGGVGENKGKGGSGSNIDWGKTGVDAAMVLLKILPMLLG